MLLEEERHKAIACRHEMRRTRKEEEEGKKEGEETRRTLRVRISKRRAKRITPKSTIVVSEEKYTDVFYEIVIARGWVARPHSSSRAGFEHRYNVCVTVVHQTTFISTNIKRRSTSRNCKETAHLQY